MTGTLLTVWAHEYALTMLKTIFEIALIGSLIRKYDPESTKSLGAEFQVIAEDFIKKINIAYAKALEEKERDGLTKK